MSIFRETTKIAFAASICALTAHAQAQTFVRSQLGAELDRATFMAEGRAGTFALATDVAISSVATAAGTNIFRPIDMGACYSFADYRFLSTPERSPFSVHH